jgi:hypothetical protein
MVLLMVLGVLALAVLGVMYAAALWIVTGKASPVAKCLAAYRIERIVRRETRGLDWHYTELTQRH